MNERDDRALMEDVNRAEHAQRLLNDTLLSASFDAIEAQILKESLRNKGQEGGLRFQIGCQHEGGDAP